MIGFAHYNLSVEKIVSSLSHSKKNYFSSATARPLHWEPKVDWRKEEIGNEFTSTSTHTLSTASQRRHCVCFAARPPLDGSGRISHKSTCQRFTHRSPWPTSCDSPLFFPPWNPCQKKFTEKIPQLSDSAGNGFIYRPLSLKTRCSGIMVWQLN
jgi:hypothetical protein